MKLKHLFCWHDWQYTFLRTYIDIGFLGKPKWYTDWAITCTKCGKKSVATTVGKHENHEHQP